MRFICYWCFLVAIGKAHGDYYAPQTFRKNIEQEAMFQPAPKSWDAVTSRQTKFQSSLFSPNFENGVGLGQTQTWKPPAREPWKAHETAEYHKSEDWKVPFNYNNKEQQAAILHHKQALTSEGSFRFEYASDNGLAAGETIEPDGSRIGAYQYKDPTGQIVKLKYKAGKDGFQILEGSHIPKSPEPVAPPMADSHYQTAFAQQKQQYNLQQQYNQQQYSQQQYSQQQPEQSYYKHQIEQSTKGIPERKYFIPDWSDGNTGEDNGEYREKENELQQRGPHSFGSGYSFSFQG